MQIAWQIEEQDILMVTNLVNQFRNHHIVKDRQKKNVDAKTSEPITRGEFWHAILCGLLTTQQKSGEGSAVSAFLDKTPNPLNLEACFEQRDLKFYAQNELKNHGGIRRFETIAGQIEENLGRLQNEDWKTLDTINNALPFSSQNVEREMANRVADSLKGIGSKQSRNILQFLGLTRYEIPLDSRVINWVNTHKIFPVHLTATGLADRYYYEFVLDGIQSICANAGILPCIIDAAVFASAERR